MQSQNEGLVERAVKDILRKQIDFIERGGRVMRMHTLPSIHLQNVAAHSFGVAWWCWLLTEGKASASLLMRALNHDLPEHVTGDLPSPVKWLLGISEQVEFEETRLLNEIRLGACVSRDEEFVFKLADALELMQHCIRERSLGNVTAQNFEMFSNIRRYIEKMLSTHLHYTVFEILNDQWRSYESK